MFLRFRRKTRISDLREGVDAVIEGRVVASKELTVPVSGTTCVFYEMSTESYRTGSRGRGRPMWLPEKFETKCPGFFVEDPSGRAWVTGVAERLTAGGLRKEAGMVGKKGRRRYMAWTLQQGDVVRVRGTASRPQKGEPPDVLVIGPDGKGRLEILVR